VDPKMADKGSPDAMHEHRVPAKPAVTSWP
jgi:hypothetical protein